MAGSLDAAVHEDITRLLAGDPVKLHIHTIAYAHYDHHQFGDYNISYNFELSEEGKKNQRKNPNIEGVNSDTDEFDGGCIEEFDINEEYPWQGNAWAWENDYLKRGISSTIKSYYSVIVKDKDGDPIKLPSGKVMRKKINKVKAIDNASMVNGKLTPELPAWMNPENNPKNDAPSVAPSPGLSPVNNSYYVYPGETHEAKVITSEPYYYIHWYIATPTGLETLVETDEGWSTGTETEASMSYTFPSDAVSGEWTISAVSKRYSNLSEGSTRSYTLTVY